MALIDKVVSYYQKDEVSGNAIDVHSTRDFTDVGSVGSGAGILNGARDYNGTSQRFSHPDNPAFSFGPNDSFFWSVWFNADTLQNNGPTPFLIGKSTTNLSGIESEYALYLDSFNNNRITWHVFGDGGFSQQSVASQAGAQTGNWTNVIAACDATASRIRLWINNGTERSESFLAGCWDGPNDVTFGGDAEGQGGFFGAFFDGRLDEIGIFSGVPTTEDRNTLYGGGIPTPYPWSPITGPAIPVFLSQYRRRRVAV